MIKKKVLSIIAVMCAMMCLVCGITAHAAGPVTFSWLQSVNPTVYAMDSTYLSPDSAIVCDGVATSSEYGTFNLKLQKKGFLGIWSDVGGTVYTVSQHSNQTYSARLGTYVTGQYFKVQWSVTGSGDYRVCFCNPSNPQVTGIQYLYLYSK